MKLLRHPVASLIIFAVLIGLCIQIYSGFEEGYNLNRTHLKEVGGENVSIMEQLQDLNLVSGIAQIKIGILQLDPPTAGVDSDIVGGLAAVGIGAVKSIIGLVTTPFEIAGIIVEYYTEIPSIITELVMMVVVYVGFLLLSIYVKGDL